MPAAGRTNDLTILVVAGVLMTVLTVVSFLIAPVDSTPRVPGSSFSARPDGGKAAYLVLKQLGHIVERSYDPAAALSRKGEGTILLLASPIESPSEQDRRALRSFVEEGGVVIVYGRSGSAFVVPGAFVAPSADDDMEEVRDFAAAMPSPLTYDAPAVSARPVPRPVLDPRLVVVFGSPTETAVVTALMGRGRLIWCLDDSPIENEGLARAANVRFLANAAGTPGARTILWDEHYHGERRSMWSYLVRTPLPWAGAQFLLVALVALAAVSRRRGPVRARFVEPRASPLEFVDTVAALYERAGAQRAAIEAARAQLRRRLSAASRLPSSSTDAALVQAAAWRLGMDANRAGTALSAAADLLRRGVRNAADAVPIVAELQELANAAAAARAGRRNSRTIRLDADAARPAEGGRHHTNLEHR